MVLQDPQSQLELQVKRRDVGTSFFALSIIASVLAVVTIVAGTYFYRSVSGEVVHRQIVIATGPESGTSHTLGEALKLKLENTGAFTTVETLNTDGSEENIRLIGCDIYALSLSQRYRNNCNNCLS